MNKEKVAEFYSEVWKKTTEKKLQWAETASDGVYMAPMAGVYTIKVFSYSELPDDGQPSLSLFAEEKLVLDITYKVFDERALQALYDLVMGQVKGTDEKIDDALGILKRL
ncbi:hypothetical protein H7849_06750 [Alloacidobacterium dinghuense]|uniref:Uncharacterized protein n=1 Tax=Alloacidobacterium dinghuense TaxID=2763107 RepID=A0A7G8BM58_9BACT|nr:hypothetical protein [Alloacidobacterium dinghuense]QNI33628.1 hypothetical protein H7849_06750 [Alloacidobacterium dinghuense]